jgi:hypothetical protein
MNSIRFIYGFLLICMLSCTDDEADIISQAEGNYSYRIRLYTLDGDIRRYLGADTDEVGVATFTKTSSGFEVTEGSTVHFAGQQIKKTADGFAFNIATQSINNSGVSITISGFKGIEIEGQQYHGMYLSDQEQLTGYTQFQGTVYDEHGSPIAVDIILEFIGTKV